MAEPILPPPEEWAGLAPRPGSITWRRAGDGRLLVAAGYALLLQVAHPTVGAGVSEHSEFRRDPWGRLLRTLDFTNVMVYGGPQAAGTMGRRIRAMHKHIKGVAPDGRRYHALEPEAYAWVHATLAEAIVAAHARVGRPLGARERERFWTEWRTLGRLLGVRERDLPPDWTSLRAYVAQMVETQLEHTPAVDDVLDALTRPDGPPIPALPGSAWRLASAPLAHVMGLATVGLLPAQLRRRFGLRWTRRQELELRAVGAAMRGTTPVLPASLRTMGPSYLRWRREAIARGDVASPERFAPAAPAAA